MGVSFVLILLTRWSIEFYVVEVFFTVKFVAYQICWSLITLGTSAVETPGQLVVVKSETVQDERLIHFSQQEVAELKAIDDVKVMDLGIL